MPDREKTIKDLRALSNIAAYNGDIQSMRTMDDAIVLLEASAPRVMTLSEARETLHNEDFVYFIEDIDGGMLVGFRAGMDYMSLSNGEYMNLDDLDEDGDLAAEYGKTFRFWTSRPSQKQILETKWEAKEGSNAEIH